MPVPFTLRITDTHTYIDAQSHRQTWSLKLRWKRRQCFSFSSIFKRAGNSTRVKRVSSAPNLDKHGKGESVREEHLKPYNIKLALTVHLVRYCAMKNPLCFFPDKIKPWNLFQGFIWFSFLGLSFSYIEATQSWLKSRKWPLHFFLCMNIPGTAAVFLPPCLDCLPLSNRLCACVSGTSERKKHEWLSWLDSSRGLCGGLWAHISRSSAGWG